jgi:hypothetical protein
MIRLDELHEDQLAQIGLRWVPLTELYDEGDLEDDVDNDNLSVLCYDGRSLDPIVIFELERLLNSGGTRDQMILVLHEFASDCDGERWFDDVEEDDLHEWGELRTGDGYVAGDS